MNGIRNYGLPTNLRRISAACEKAGGETWVTESIATVVGTMAGDLSLGLQGLSMSAVVGVVGQDGEGSVELFGEDHTSKFVGEGHGAEREEQSGGLGCGFGAGLG